MNGSVSLRNLEINASKVNTLLKLPGIQVTEGRVEEVSLQIPVRDVLSGKISVKIHGIQVLVRPCSDTRTPPNPLGPCKTIFNLEHADFVRQTRRACP